MQPAVAKYAITKHNMLLSAKLTQYLALDTNWAPMETPYG